MNCNEIKTLLKEKEDRYIQIQNNTIKCFDLIKNDVVGTLIKMAIDSNFETVCLSAGCVCKHVYDSQGIDSYGYENFVFWRSSFECGEIGEVDLMHLHRLLHEYILTKGFKSNRFCEDYEDDTHYNMTRKRLLKVCCSDSASTKDKTDSITLKIGFALLVMFVLLCIFKLMV